MKEKEIYAFSKVKVYILFPLNGHNEKSKTLYRHKKF